MEFKRSQKNEKKEKVKKKKVKKKKKCHTANGNKYSLSMCKLIRVDVCKVQSLMIND